MKKIFIAVFIVALLVLNLNAQILVKGGVNLAGFSFSDEGESTNSITGFQFGVAANVPISDTISFYSELLWSTGGNEQKSGSITSKVTVGYIKVPLMFKFKIFGNKAFTLRLGGGCFVAYNLSAKETLKSGSAEFDIDLKKKVEKLDGGFVMGIETMIQEHFSLELRYTLGLMNIRKSIYTGETVRNKSFEIILGYAF